MLETRHDGRTIDARIAVVTVSFLPATCVSSFCGMDFFNGIAGSIPFNEASRNVWVFFVVAVPISAVVLVVFV
jgi:Mg2+ and Co2+ transporter CorA